MLTTTMRSGAAAAAQVQTISVTGPSSSSFQMTFDGMTSVAVPLFQLTLADLETAIQAALTA